SRIALSLSRFLAVASSPMPSLDGNAMCATAPHTNTNSAPTTAASRIFNRYSLRRDQMERRLAPVEEAHARAVEERVLLELDGHLLAVPLGHRGGRGELDRVDRARVHARVARAGDARLQVPQA